MTQLKTQIRRATAADAEALSRLSAAIFPLGCPANTRAEDLAEYIGRELTPERFHALLTNERIAILLVEIGGQPAGYAMVELGATHPQLPRAERELRKFYIDAAYHGRGVANTLMQQVLATVGDGSLWLSVFSGNPRAIAFYTRWGFRVAGQQEFVVGTDHQQDYLMQRDANHDTKEDTACN
jgi:ribosomal protein S18 acetylase RimI-like enzyme